MTTPERVRSPRDVHGAPQRLDSHDADAAARRVLADYVRQQQAAVRGAGDGRAAARVAVVIGLAALGAVLGAAVGSLRGIALPLACGMGLVGALLGAITTRR